MSRTFVLLAAFISVALSLYLWSIGQQMAAIFVGIWVPSILEFGAHWRS